jgi:hypothetical protein
VSAWVEERIAARKALRGEKPEHFYDIVRAASYEPFGEAFQRQPRPDITNLFTSAPPSETSWFDRPHRQRACRHEAAAPPLAPVLLESLPALRRRTFWLLQSGQIGLACTPSELRRGTARGPDDREARAAARRPRVRRSPSRRKTVVQQPWTALSAAGGLSPGVSRNSKSTQRFRRNLRDSPVGVFSSFDTSCSIEE